jgi:hypothetical protein
MLRASPFGARKAVAVTDELRSAKTHRYPIEPNNWPNIRAHRSAMSRSRINRTGRSTKPPRHVRLYHWLMETPAWRSLNGNQRAIYIDIAARYAGEGSNNGRIPYSIREAAENLRIGKSTAARCLRVLQERGFIVAMTKGAFSRKVRHATEWRLTEFQCDVSDKLATKEFASWNGET